MRLKALRGLAGGELRPDGVPLCVLDLADLGEHIHVGKAYFLGEFAGGNLERCSDRVGRAAVLGAQAFERGPDFWNPVVAPLGAMPVDRPQV